MEEKLLPAAKDTMVPLQTNQQYQELHACETVFSPLYCRATRVRQQTQFVVRSDAPAPDWPRQYKAESLDISLHLSRSSPGNYLLLGILTSVHATESIDTFEGMPTELYASPGPFAAEGDKQAEKPLLRTQVDDLGHIVFSNVPEGEYVMILHLTGLDVVIEELSIKYT
jgi:hypothetical protein